MYHPQNYINPNTVREITSLRHDFLSALSALALIPPSSTPSSPALNTHSTNHALIKSVILGGLWPRIARIHLPKSAIKFDRLVTGTVKRENTAREYRVYGLDGERVFLHPGSVLFGVVGWKSPVVAYFQKQMTSKVFLRDATQVSGCGLVTMCFETFIHYRSLCMLSCYWADM